MKRFHVHVSVDDLGKSTDFYSKLFGQQPSVEKSDYAKWMLDDPRVNFAISTRGQTKGVNHFGFQAEDSAELAELKQRAQAAAGDAILDEGETGCCYALSDKHWVTDPSGLAWEHYHTMQEIQSYGLTEELACCLPEGVSEPSGCCVPAVESGKSCC
ncbi:MAG: ArsI/CadI family heavy metal resistance metalloenzyme [Thiolinea sp.]